MPVHIPRAICLGDQIEMITSRNGVLVEMIAEWGAYYKIYADELKCPVCDDKVLIPAEKPVAEHFEPVYHNYTGQLRAKFYEP